MAATLLITGSGRTDRNSDARIPGGRVLRIGVDRAVAGALAAPGCRRCGMTSGVGASGGDYCGPGWTTGAPTRALRSAGLPNGGLPLLAVEISAGPWYAAELAADDAVAGAVLLAARSGRELFDMMNAAREDAYRRSHPFQQSGPMQGQQSPGPGGTDDGDYDHYNVEGSDPNLRGRIPRRGGRALTLTSTMTASPTTSARRCS